MATSRKLWMQIAAVLGGAAVGFGAEWLSRPEADRRLYLAAFTAAWLAMGVVTIVTGEVWWEAPNARETDWYGIPARIVGVLMLLAALVLYFVIDP